MVYTNNTPSNSNQHNLRRNPRHNNNNNQPVKNNDTPEGSVARYPQKTTERDDIKIILDTETTGLSPTKDDRLCEIACIEMNNFKETGNVFHVYINPQKKMPKNAFNVHGLSDDFLSDKPLFKEIANSFLQFIGNSPLVIHNAAFDMRFLNAELEKINKPPLDNDIIDTMKIAKKKFKGESVKLNALCEKFGISLKSRAENHGALIDTKLLADVYRHLCQETHSDSSSESDEPVAKKAKHYK
jgi:DNA polymerase-3 subunit epsilon